MSIKTISTVSHVLAAVCAMGAAFSADILFHFFAADRKLSRMEARVLSILSRVVWYGLLAVAVTGAAIFLSDPARYLASAKFLGKMTMTAVLVANGLLLDRYVRAHLLGRGFFTARREAFARKAAFACGAVSAPTWVSILALGVMDSVRYSYGAVIGMYGAIIAAAVFASLVFERVAFEPKRSRS